VAELSAGLEGSTSLQGMLGYLNFSEGRPDARFQKQLNDAYAYLAEHGAVAPWTSLNEALGAKLEALRQSGAGAFQDVRQAEAVLQLVFAKTLPAYRRHHADLLFHLSDRDLFQPFFLARVIEAVLTQGAPWSDEERIVAGALRQLNDFLGHRPVAILETRPKGEPYEHERVRPIPLFLRGAGVAFGRYHDLVAKALEILAATDPAILAEADFDPNLLDELAADPRAYDHGHPANRRPNYVFGEWDPHHLDNQGRYRRYVARQITLDGLLDRVAQAQRSTNAGEGGGDAGLAGLTPEEALYEAAAVLAGTLLMATGLCGSSPTAHDSSTTLSTLMPRIARYRDAFYAGLLQALTGSHGNRLRADMTRTRQPFGGARQHLNQYVARQRAAQLQQRHLSLLFAEMGYPEASRREAACIPATSVRLVSEIWIRLTTGRARADQGELARAAGLLPEIDDLLRRGIGCGALVDPWNILGFQGLFPLFTAQEDSIRDQRIDELIHVIERTLDLYARLASESAGAGERALTTSLLADLQRFAAWWDRFASVEVSDMRRVHGGEALASARHVATALARWHERGEAVADLAFWREHLEGFQSPKAFALVVEALLAKQDYRAAMGLLMNWLSQAEQVPLEDGAFSFHTLALRWMLSLAREETQGQAASSLPSAAGGWPLMKKFFDYLEANAEEQVQLPEWEETATAEESAEEEEDLYGAAYEEVTYRDSADDDQEGTIIEGPAPGRDFALEWAGEPIQRCLRFLSTWARLWLVAARQAARAPTDPDREATLRHWLNEAEKSRQMVLKALDRLHDYPIPEPFGTHDSLVEYDRRRLLKERVLTRAIGTCHDLFMATGAIRGAVGKAANPTEPGGEGEPEWHASAVRLEQALVRGDAAEVRTVLPVFLEPFRHEPLLFTALADGGHPRQILRARIAQSILWALVANLPRLGLLRETYHLLKTANAMEEAHPTQGRKVTEFDRLFQLALQAVTEKLMESPEAWLPFPEGELGAGPLAEAFGVEQRKRVEILRRVTNPFLELWLRHSQTLRISVLETARGEEFWRGLRDFVQRYGNELFHPRFLTLANLRAILHRGVGTYLDSLGEEPDPLHPLRLLDDLGRAVSRADAVKYLDFILQALVENYEEYKDYNSSTAQSDYGENVHVLLAFLQLKAVYERHAWQFRPLFQVHEVLCRKGQTEAADLWQKTFELHRLLVATRLLEQLAQLEQTHGIRLRTITDRLEERFEKPLQMDSLCALVAHTIAEAGRPEGGTSFRAFEQALQALAASPSGVGLDVPHWLRRLEQEVQRVRAGGTPLASLAEDSFPVPQGVLSFEDLRQQLEDWDKPLTTEREPDGA
jgi:hypothetical protein